MNQISKPQQLQCGRCRTYVNSDEIETLLFESRYKKTDLLLCKTCFQLCRETFIKWMENKET